MQAIMKARALLAEQTPLPTDCGALCGAACCATDEDGQGGVSLFPGEEALYAQCAWGHTQKDTVTGLARMLVCDGMCDRANRPFACRMFPLTPICRSDGTWSVRIDVRARAMCPLAKSGVHGLDPAFVALCEKAVRELANDPVQRSFLRKWAALERRYHFTL